MHKAQRLINHVALVLDGSTSMHKHQEKLIKVADEQIQHLAIRSEELQQETRVSVYLFGSNVTCLIFDMDVMRLPSIADLYQVNGMTALVDSVFKSQEDLSTTSQIYGDHAFLTFVLTDGEENRSRQHSWTELGPYLNRLKENQTVGFLVPNKDGLYWMKKIGVDASFCAVWDTDSANGVVDAVSTIRTATESFMTNREKGVRGTRSIFSTGAEAVNKHTVALTLTPLDIKNYGIYQCRIDGRIDATVKDITGSYKIGQGYYQLTKTETIQPQKKIIVVDKRSNQAYSGTEARHLIGLPDGKPVRVKPDYNPDYDIYVQSTSINRKLLAGTNLLVTY